MRLAQTLALTLVASIVTSCQVIHRGNHSRHEADPPPDLVLHIVDNDFGRYLYNCDIDVKDDSVTQSGGWGGYYQLFGVNDSAIAITISSEQYRSLDTVLTFSTQSIDTIEVGLTSNVIASGQPDKRTGPYLIGWNKAEALLNDNNACIYRAGGLPGGGLILIDENTGLPIRGNFTCIVDDEIMERSEGHNDRIGLYIHRHGLPSNSKKRWIGLIASPDHYFDSLKEAGEVLTLTRDQDTIATPWDQYAVSISTVTDTDNDRGRLEIHNLTTGETKSDAIFGINKRTSVEIAWGPDDSELILVKTKEYLFVIELRQCETLNVEQM